MQRLWYVSLTLGNRLSGFFGTQSHLQSYVSVSPSSTGFHRKENILRLEFDLRVPGLAWYLACSRHILDKFGDFSDYQRDNKVDFLVNGAILAALNEGNCAVRSEMPQMRRPRVGGRGGKEKGKEREI